ncbi:MAG: hypothetical protein RR891_07945 [Clostridium sp.]|uniref:hypothetical protein n=1 Tax=Clostridium sp. TaxID=1506 RepID=UPI00302DC6FF
MNNDKSQPVYPPDKHDYYGEYRSITPMADSAWDNVREAEIEAARARHHRDYSMEMGEDITFDNLNEDINSEDEIEFKSIIEDVDMSNHGNEYGYEAGKEVR